MTFIWFICGLKTVEIIYYGVWQKLWVTIAAAMGKSHIWFAGLVCAGRDVLPGVSIYDKKCADKLSWEKLTMSDGLFACLAVLNWMATYTTLCFTDLPELGVITLWTACNRFTKPIAKSLSDKSRADNQDLEWRHIYSGYKVLRHLSHLINRAFGTTMFLYTGFSILECTTTLQYLPFGTDIVDSLDGAFWAIFILVILSLAANVCTKVCLSLLVIHVNVSAGGGGGRVCSALILSFLSAQSKYR